MTFILIFIIGFALGAIFMHWNLKKDGGGLGFLKNTSKSENMGKVLEMFDSSEKLTNNDVEKELGVSDATSERYLDDLEKAGLIKQVGDTGSGVYYLKK